MEWIVGLSAITGAILGFEFAHVLCVAISTMLLAGIVGIWAVETSYPHLMLLALFSITAHQMAYLAFGFVRGIWFAPSDRLAESASVRQRGSESQQRIEKVRRSRGQVKPW